MRLTLALLLYSVYGFSQSIETVIQKGHELAVVTVAVSADTNYIATGSKDKSIKIWEVSTGREVRSLLGHELTVTSLAFSANGKFLLSGSNDKTIRYWEVSTGKEIFTISSENIITSLTIAPDENYFVAAGYGNSGYEDSSSVYDFKTKKALVKLPVSADKGLGGGVSVAISNDGKWLAFGEDNRVVRVYETTTWKNTHTFNFTEGYCGGCGTRVVFSNDNKHLLMASHNGPVKKYSLADSKLLRVYEESTKDLTGFAISGNDKLLARATEKNIVVWNQQTGEQLAVLEAPEKGAFHEIVFSNNSKQLLVSSDNNTAFLWDYQTKKTTQLFTGFLNHRDQGGLNYDPNFYWQSNIARYVRFKNPLLISNDGKTLIKGKFGTKVKQWEVASGRTVMEFTSHKKAVLSYDLSRDGKKLVTGGGDGKIVVWDVATGDTLQAIQSYREPIFDISFNSDETKVVSSSWDATMKIHSLETKKLEHYFDFENSSAYSLIFHPNDLYLFTGRLNNSIQLWEIDTKKAVRDFVGHTDIISSITLSADQTTLLSSSWDGSIRVWDVGTGLMKKKFKHPAGTVHTAIFNSTSTYVYSAGADRIIRMWDINTSRIIQQFDGHKAEITSLVLSPDAKMLISHSVDGVTKFWDLTTGKEFFEHIHLGEKDWMAKSPDGYFHGTEAARSYIHFVEGNKTYSVDQFFNDFYRPDLLPTIFKNRGSASDLKDVQGKLKTSPPPTLKLAVLETSGNTAELFVKITDSGSGVQSLKLFHNGKNITLLRENLKLPNGKGETSVYKHVVNLVGGANTFTAVASNKQRVESDPQEVELFSEQVSKNSTCYILAVGINQYKNPKLQLNYARSDATSFSEIMESKSNTLFKTINVIELYDAEASRYNILRTLDELAAKVNTEDVFILYYAGHGSMVDNKFYFIPTESSRLYDASSLQKEAIEAGALQEKLKNIRALKQLIIMDACQSGGSVELLATRGANEEKAIAQLSRSSGIHVMASAGSEQFATEFASLGHGLFTYVLIKALQGEADGAPKDGKVTIYELKSYLDDQVPDMTRKLKGKPQYPYTFSRGQDFPILIRE